MKVNQVIFNENVFSESAGPLTTRRRAKNQRIDWLIETKDGDVLVALNAHSTGVNTEYRTTGWSLSNITLNNLPKIFILNHKKCWNNSKKKLTKHLIWKFNLFMFCQLLCVLHLMEICRGGGGQPIVCKIKWVFSPKHLATLSTRTRLFVFKSVINWYFHVRSSIFWSQCVSPLKL